MILIAVAIGGALGAVLRFILTGRIDVLTALEFPYGTMLVNLSGCFAMGLIAATFNRYAFLNNDIKAFIGAGVLGGYTTFSRFTFDAFMLVEKGEVKQAFIYTAVSVFGSLLLFAAGFYPLKYLFKAV